MTSMTPTSCKVCNGSTWIVTSDKEGKEIFTRCKCYEVQLAKEKWERSGFNADSKEKTFSTFKEISNTAKQAKIIAHRYTKDFQKIKDDRINSLILMGQPGSGKTHLCIATSLNLLSKGVSVLYMSYREAITALKQNMTDEDYYQKQINSYKNAKVLFIDDLFKGKITETDINIMFEIINYRYLKHLPIIVSTEYVMEQLLDKDEATASRIYEMSKGYSYEIVGRESNYRLKA